MLAWLHSIEFHKRGLPHVHILVSLVPTDRLHPKKLELISAEIPLPLQTLNFMPLSRHIWCIDHLVHSTGTVHACRMGNAQRHVYRNLLSRSKMATPGAKEDHLHTEGTLPRSKCSKLSKESTTSGLFPTIPGSYGSVGRMGRGFTLQNNLLWNAQLHSQWMELQNPWMTGTFPCWCRLHTFLPLSQV